jgi:hypothetical protein
MGARVAPAELGSAGAVAERLAAGLPGGFAGGVVLPDKGAAERIGADLAPLLGGDTASIRIRAATLDLHRRSLPASR